MQSLILRLSLLLVSVAIVGAVPVPGSDQGMVTVQGTS